MSALEMTANGEKISGGAAQKIDEAIDQLREAQRLVAALQEQANQGLCDTSDPSRARNHLWHCLETIDDRIHDALSKLGN